MIFSVKLEKRVSLSIRVSSLPSAWVALRLWKSLYSLREVCYTVRFPNNCPAQALLSRGAIVVNRAKVGWNNLSDMRCSDIVTMKSFPWQTLAVISLPSGKWMVPWVNQMGFKRILISWYADFHNHNYRILTHVVDMVGDNTFVEFNTICVKMAYTSIVWGNLAHKCVI